MDIKLIIRERFGSTTPPTLTQDHHLRRACEILDHVSDMLVIMVREHENVEVAEAIVRNALTVTLAEFITATCEACISREQAVAALKDAVSLIEREARQRADYLDHM